MFYSNLSKFFHFVFMLLLGSATDIFLQCKDARKIKVYKTKKYTHTYSEIIHNKLTIHTHTAVIKKSPKAIT